MDINGLIAVSLQKSVIELSAFILSTNYSDNDFETQLHMMTECRSMLYIK